MKWLRSVLAYFGLVRVPPRDTDAKEKASRQLARRADALLADYKRQDKQIRLVVVKKPR